jgi:SAM-dependent methyltransferase
VGGNRSLLDIGCGTGEFLHVASTRGWHCRGVEISAYAAEYARTKYGVTVHTGILKPGLFPEHSFAAISLWDVIEHLPDPAATLSICARLLHPRGVLTLSTGDVESVCAKLCGRHWHLFNVPEHVFFFSARSIRTLLGRTGFAPEAITYPGSYYPVGYLFERLYKTAVRPGRATPGFVASWLVPFNLFDIMQVTAVVRDAIPTER